ncbi:MAG: glutamate--tRNA ligase [Bacteroidetes bacterium]|nr:MAG: glutamate--tRNA ligase [Bacteroidota bacterium]
MDKRVRVRFAPSPTGGLHLGGVRTALFNYLFAKKHQGDFLLRIEDTDQSRFVHGAEEYIFETLRWCGIEPDESAVHGGPHGPYRQSERKSSYRQYAEQLVRAGKAYYAFELPEELETMRGRFKTADNPSPQYDHRIRMNMRNSCSLTLEETERLLDDDAPHVIRIKMPENETVVISDLIRGEVSFHTGLIDDKVLLKADGMPTYHLAVVVDDFFMKISHAFRGEEWLPSAPVHVLLWRYLFGEENMPQWAHLPLILKPDGNGKLSKRDGDRLGFPVFAMDWKDPNSGETIKGFRERGFLPEAFINMLALLGWNDGTGKEIFSLNELIDAFSMERVHKAGAKFDYEKAKWFNHEWIRQMPVSAYKDVVKEIFVTNGVGINDEARFEKILSLVKDRCTLLNDFYDESRFFFEPPTQWDIESVKPKWNPDKKNFFESFVSQVESISSFDPVSIESNFKQLAGEKNIKPGELQLPFRIMLVGEKKGPPVFEIAGLLGKTDTINRIRHFLDAISV